MRDLFIVHVYKFVTVLSNVRFYISIYLRCTNYVPCKGSPKGCHMHQSHFKILISFNLRINFGTKHVFLQSELFLRERVAKPS